MNPEIDSLLGDTLTLVCPDCRSGHLILEGNTAQCKNCNASFNVKNGIVDLFPDSPRQEHIWGGALEWKPFVQFYESRFWRRGLVNNLYLALSFDDELDIIRKAVNLEESTTVLDLACGSGIYTRPFAKWVNGTVVGLDLSMPMLEYATGKAQEEHISNIVFIHGDAHALPFLKNQFDVVNCSGALHAFSDISRALSEMYRVLTPGGRFTGGIGRWPWTSTFNRKFRDWYKRRAGIKGFYREELESLFNDAGFSEVVFHYEKRAWFILSAVKPG
jgi:SAM-dependent methyltransferase